MNDHERKLSYRATFISLSIEYKDCRGAGDCCNEGNKCEENEGDCDSDQDCKDGLICGSNNCKYDSGFEWDSTDDCCTKPKGRKNKQFCL